MDNLHQQKIKVWILSGATFLSGIFNIIHPLFARFKGRTEMLSYFFSLQIHQFGRSLSLIFGFLLIYFSFNLFQQKRNAWFVVALISLLSIITNFSYRHSFLYVIGPLLLLILLFLWKKEFFVKSETSSILQGIVRIFGIVLLAIAWGSLGFWLLDKRDFGINFQLLDSIFRAFKEIFFVGNSDIVAHTRYARWFLDSLNIVGIIIVVLSADSLFHPLKYRLTVLPLERKLAKNILEKYSLSTDDYFRLLKDKLYFFSEDKRNFISYQVASGTAIVLGDTMGPEDGAEKTTKDFLELCFRSGWGVIFLNVFPNFIDIYKKLGLRVIKIGEEAIVDINHFFDTTFQKKDLNTSFRRVQRKFEKMNYATERYLPPHKTELIDELREISNEWMSLPNRKEFGFALGKFEKNYVEKVAFFVVRDEKGKAIAFVNEIPSFRKGEVTIDMMRHRVNVPNSTMEFLFLELLKKLQQEGYRKFNLGFVPFVGIGENEEAGIEEKGIKTLLKFLKQYSFTGLQAFKNKFEPEWGERFAVYKGPLHLPKIIFAVRKLIEG